MEIQKMEQEQATNTVIAHVHAFPVCRVDLVGSGLVLPDDSKICLKPVAKYDPKEPGLARPDFDNQVSVQEVISSYRDQTGLAYALRQINAGRLHPFQLNDNGKGGVDLRGLPDNVNDAYQVMNSSTAAATRVASRLGIAELDPQNIQKVVQDAIDKRIAELSAKEVKQNE